MDAQVYMCKHVCICVCCVSEYMCVCMHMYVVYCVCAYAQPVRKAACSVDCPKYPSNVATDSTKDSMSMLAEKANF